MRTKRKEDGVCFKLVQVSSYAVSKRNHPQVCFRYDGGKVLVNCSALKDAKYKWKQRRRVHLAWNKA